MNDIRKEISKVSYGLSDNGDTSPLHGPSLPSDHVTFKFHYSDPVGLQPTISCTPPFYIVKNQHLANNDKTINNIIINSIIINELGN